MEENDNHVVAYFDYGANKEGYWSYEDIIVHLENCLGILKTLFLPEVCAVQILVDHSCGHNRQREDILDVRSMNSGYGGAQRIIRLSIMKEVCLGKFNPTLKIGNQQQMLCQATNDGSFYMPENERKALKEVDLKPSNFANSEKEECYVHAV